VRWDFGYCGHYWSIVPAPDGRWGWLWRNSWNEDWQGKPKYSEKTYRSATLNTKNPTWLDPVLNPGRRGGKPATNRLSYGAAVACIIVPQPTTLPRADGHTMLKILGEEYKIWNLSVCSFLHFTVILHAKCKCSFRLSSCFSTKMLQALYNSDLSHVFHMAYPSHYAWFDHITGFNEDYRLSVCL
jgi:hypothetical protein